ELIPDSTYVGGITLLEEKGLASLKETVFNYSFSDNERTLTFYLEKDFTRIFERVYSLNDDYSIDMHISMNDLATVRGYDIDFGSGIKDTENYVKNKRMDYKFIAQINNAVESLTLSKLKTIRDYAGKTDWAANRSKYFLIGLLPDKAVPSNQITAFMNNDSPAFILKVRNADYSTRISDDYRLYFGPSDIDELKKLNAGMESVVERGAKWLKPLANVFAYFLSWLYKYIPNYGIVLIILAILLKIVLNPLTHKSLESGQKMQKIQPLLKEIQVRYKNDPKRLQEELQKVYKENKVSPLGGCLPLLLQMPIFIALYNVLRYSLDMRQAGFFGYITDLSEPDKLYILPIIMAVMMFVQQKMMSPKPIQNEKGEIDEKQAAMVQSQRMMLYVMPIMMFWIFKSMPAGLVLYWTTMNVLSIIQQFQIKKRLQG
ncbi:MAG: YidC/Oxa1 family insertase periplasmic-domain containing protein, partial [Candidatus Cloacimonetes bacterium]|nr:YidC/Oxa1 family insertase periplasmic-domain containing protein [Candidatus Cloacimonadota bacterium]